MRSATMHERVGVRLAVEADGTAYKGLEHESE